MPSGARGIAASTFTSSVGPTHFAATGVSQFETNIASPRFTTRGSEVGSFYEITFKLLQPHRYDYTASVGRPHPEGLRPSVKHGSTTVRSHSTTEWRCSKLPALLPNTRPLPSITPAGEKKPPRPEETASTAAWRNLVSAARSAGLSEYTGRAEEQALPSSSNTSDLNESFMLRRAQVWIAVGEAVCLRHFVSAPLNSSRSPTMRTSFPDSGTCSDTARLDVLRPTH